MRIAFIGPMRVGKDTAAEYLQKKYGGQIFKFADPLYEIQKEIYKIVNLPEKKDRLLLQWIGTEWGRKTIDPDIWLNIMTLKLSKTNGNIYVTDARFPNEVKLLKEAGFKLIKIEACERIRVERGATNLTHESETALDHYRDYDAVIDNTSDLETFYEGVDWSCNEVCEETSSY